VQRQFGYENLNRLISAQDFLPTTTGDGTFSGTGLSCTQPSSSGSTFRSGAIPWWTNPDDSNMVADGDDPTAPGWDSSNTMIPAGNTVLAPDGNMTAGSITANAGDSLIVVHG
jgi:hypothetical protein